MAFWNGLGAAALFNLSSIFPSVLHPKIINLSAEDHKTYPQLNILYLMLISEPFIEFYFFMDLSTLAEEE